LDFSSGSVLGNARTQEYVDRMLFIYVGMKENTTM